MILPTNGDENLFDRRDYELGTFHGPLIVGIGYFIVVGISKTEGRVTKLKSRILIASCGLVGSNK
jgi:hypothetical protein